MYDSLIWKFWNIILRYTSSGYITELSIVLKNSIPFDEYPCSPFGSFFRKTQKKMNRTSKNEILWHGALLCVLVARKNNKIYFFQIVRKILSRKVLSSINIYKFQVKRPRYDHPRGIVCDNVPIFGIQVYLDVGVMP